MAGSAQLWPGPRMRAFFRAIFAAEKGVDAALAERLADAATRRINRMLVWDATGADPSPQPAMAAAPSPVSHQAVHKTVTEAAVPEGSEPAFDPFEFSVVVMLKRQGRAALRKRLDAIGSADNLRRIADAQHLGVDKAVKSADKLRDAIVSGAEQRLADRRAAAS